MDKLNMHTPNLADENFRKLAALFPEAVTESIDETTGEVVRAIDKDVLTQLISTRVVEGREERYQFTWPDKKKAMLAANAPIRATLRPVRAESAGRDGTPGGFDSENLYIEGDNLDVLKLLRETYLGKVKMIYIDPPYNTGNDFVYEDDFDKDAAEYLPHSGQYDEQGNRLVQNTERNGRFHTDWLNMIYPRLRVAKDLLAEDGVIFISLDNNEIKNLMSICNEIFSEQCFVECITWNKRVPKNDNNGIGNIHEYILVYVKSINCVRQFSMQKEGLDEVFGLLVELRKKKTPIPEAERLLRQLYDKKGYDRGITLYCNLDDDYEPWGKINMSWPNADTFGTRYDVIHPVTGLPTKVPDRGWRWNRTTFLSSVNYDHIIERYDGSYVCGNIWFSRDEKTQPSSIKYLRDVGKMLLRSIISLKSDGGIEMEHLFDGKSYFSYPKPVSLLCLLLASLEEKEGLFLDFFSGSATTAHAVMKLNAEDGGHRKFIMVQLPEICTPDSEAAKAGYPTICEIGKERIRRAGNRVRSEILEHGQELRDLSQQSDNQSPVKSSKAYWVESPEYIAGNVELANNLDIGFRVLKLDSTNMQEVYYTPQAMAQSLLDATTDNIKPDRTPEDLLFQVMLELGVELSSKIEETTIAGKRVFCVADGFLLACFDTGVNADTVTAIAKQKPYYAVFRDSGMANDSVATNFDQIFQTYSQNTVRKVL